MLATPTPSAAPRLVPGWASLLGLVVLALAGYLPTALRASFLNFDDNFFFGPDNPLFRAAQAASEQHGVFAGLWLVLDPRQTVADVYLPVSHGSLWLDYWWFGGQPVGPHVVAALLHALAAFALLRFLLALRVAPVLAHGVAAVFVLHPALCESVAWVSGRKDVLSGLFVFLALLQVVRACDRASALRLCAIAAFGALAMYSKATAVVQPLLAVLVCLYVPGPRARWLGPAVLAAVTLPIAWHHQLIAAQAGTMAGGSALARLPQVPGAFLHYAAVALWPAQLNVLYPEVQTLERFRAAWPAGVAAMVALLAIAVATWRRPPLRAAAFGALAFALALLPFNTAFPASVIAAADRYLYLALPFAALLLLVPLAHALRQPMLVAAVATIACLVACLLRAPAFANSEALWRASLAADEGNAVAWLNLANARLARGSVDAAVLTQVTEWAGKAAQAARYPEHEWRARQLQMQMALYQGDYASAARFAEQAVVAAEHIAADGRHAAPVAQARLVQSLLYALTPLRASGRLADARAVLQRVETLAPNDSAVVAASVLIATDDLAAAVRSQEPPTPPAADDVRVTALRARLDAALAAVQQRGKDNQDAAIAAQLLRDQQVLLLAQGKLERLLGNSMKALRSFRLAIAAARVQTSADPQAAESWLGAAEVCLEQGIYPAAEEYARAGVAWFNDRGVVPDARLRHALARSLAGQGRLDEAIGHMASYCDVHEHDRDAGRLLSSLLMGKAVARLSDNKVTHQELRDLIERALRYNKDEPRVDLVRARILHDQRNYAEAIEALDRARKALPDYADALTMLCDNLRALGYERMLAKDDDGAARAWRRFLDLAPKEQPTDAVQMQLDAIWRRAEQRGIEARKNGDAATAATEFRRCLQIDPQQHWAAWHLAQVLFERLDSDPQELDLRSRQALEWAQHQQLDTSRQVLLRAMVLHRQQHVPEALQLLDGYLAAVPAEAPADTVTRLRGLRQMLDLLQRGR